MSGRIDAKPSTCTEHRDVDPTGISVKVSASYPGRSDGLPWLPASRGVGKDHQKSAEAIVAPRKRDEGPNVKYGSRTTDLEASRRSRSLRK